MTGLMTKTDSTVQPVNNAAAVGGGRRGGVEESSTAVQVTT